MSEVRAERILRRAALQARRNADRHAAEATRVTIAPEAVNVQNPSADDVRRYEARRDAAERAERVRAAFAGANVPEIFTDARLGDASRVPLDVRDRYVAAMAKMAIASERPGIYALVGEIGPGKSHLACALINDFCLGGRSARYVKAVDYVRDYRSTWKSNQLGAEAAFEAAHVRLALLVLDEWQVRSDTINENQILLRVLDKRYDNRRTTVIIGNHRTAEEFERTIDARVADRICDAGGIIVCDWPSIRGRLL